MKKLLIELLALLLCFSLVACKSDDTSSETTKKEESTTTEVVETTTEDTKVEEPATEETVIDGTEIKEEVNNDTTQTYWVNFLNYDGSVLQRTTYKTGETPKYNGSTPTYSDGAYTYTFTGWDKKISTVYMTQIYNAVYTRVAITNNKDACEEAYGVAYAGINAQGKYYVNGYEPGWYTPNFGNTTTEKPKGYDGEGWYHIDSNRNLVEKCKKSSDLEVKLAHNLIDYPEAIEDLVYDGTELNLVSAGVGTTFKYSVEHESIVSETGTVVPFAVDAGDYIVRYSIDNGTTWSKGINVSIAKRDITIASTTDSKTYDGTPLARNEAGDAYPVAGSLGAGDTFSVTMDASITNAGSVTNKIDDVVFFDVDGNDISYNYNATKQEGTLTITPVLVDLPVISFTQNGTMYDIEVDAADSRYEYSSGDTIATAVGTYNVTVSLKDKTNTAWNLATPTSDDQSITWEIVAPQLCSNHNDHYLVTGGTDGLYIDVTPYTWNGSAFVEGVAATINRGNFWDNPQEGNYYAVDGDHGSYLTKCNGNH